VGGGGNAACSSARFIAEARSGPANKFQAANVVTIETVAIATCTSFQLFFGAGLLAMMKTPF
jgi:hypothetical protein